MWLWGWNAIKKIRSRSLKPNQHFIMSQYYIHAKLVKIHPPVHEISCIQESVTPTPTPTPTGSAPKTICPLPFSGGHKYPCRRINMDVTLGSFYICKQIYTCKDTYVCIILRMWTAFKNTKRVWYVSFLLFSLDVIGKLLFCDCDTFWVYSFVFCITFQVKSPQKDIGIKKHLSHASGEGEIFSRR